MIRQTGRFAVSVLPDVYLSSVLMFILVIMDNCFIVTFRTRIISFRYLVLTSASVSCLPYSSLAMRPITFPFRFRYCPILNYIFSVRQDASV